MNGIDGLMEEGKEVSADGGMDGKVTNKNQKSGNKKKIKKDFFVFFCVFCNKITNRNTLVSLSHNYYLK